MKKNSFEKKEYSKAEIEFVKFDYATVCADSNGVEDVTDPEEGPPLMGAIFNPSAWNESTDTSVENSEHEDEKLDGGGGNSITNTAEGSDANASVDTSEPVEVQAEQGGQSFGEALLDTITLQEKIEVSGYDNTNTTTEVVGGGSENTVEKGFSDPEPSEGTE